MSYCKIGHVLAYKGGTGTFLDIAVLVSFRADSLSRMHEVEWNKTILVLTSNEASLYKLTCKVREYSMKCRIKTNISAAASNIFCFHLSFCG